MAAARSRPSTLHRRRARAARAGAGAAADARAHRGPGRGRARAGALADHEPARLGPRAHRRLRGSVARPPPRRAAHCCAPTSPTSTTPSRRRAPCAARSSARPPSPARLPRARARPQRRGARARAAPATATSARWWCATSSSTARRCARRWRSPGCCRPGSRRSAPQPGSDGWVACAGGALRDGRARRRLRLRQRAPAPPRRARLVPDRARPVSNASWMHFSEGGGYERREWWSDEGWAWKQEYDITHHPAVATGDPEAPVCHVSWFEADAFARAHDARLPTEAEWERARRALGQDGQTAEIEGVGRSGSGRAPVSAATRAFARTPTASTPRCSSAIATACCAAARGRPTRASRRSPSATGTCR